MLGGRPLQTPRYRLPVINATETGARVVVEGMGHGKGEQAESNTRGSIRAAGLCLAYFSLFLLKWREE